MIDIPMSVDERLKYRVVVPNVRPHEILSY